VIRRWALALAAILAAGCASSGLRVDGEPDPGVPPERIPETPDEPIRLDMSLERVEMAYLGSGGWLIEVDGAAIMTGPLFSNPDLASVLFGRIEPDPPRIQRALDTLRTDHVEAILVGHAHYDHLMDVPATIRHHAKTAVVYGGPTAVHIIAGSIPSGAAVAITPGQAGSSSHAGQWFPASPNRFRWMAVRSKHSNHYWKIQLFKGRVESPLRELPTRASGWKVGETYAYVIEILDSEGKAALRIFYNDSGSTWPDGFPPPEVVTGDIPTVAILTAPGYKWEKQYPERVIDYLKPAYVIAGHWEDFFRPQDGNPEPTIGTFFGAFVDRMNRTGVPWAAPNPDDRFVFVRR